MSKLNNYMIHGQKPNLFQETSYMYCTVGMRKLFDEKIEEKIS